MPKMHGNCLLKLPGVLSYWRRNISTRTDAQAQQLGTDVPFQQVRTDAHSQQVGTDAQAQQVGTDVPSQQIRTGALCYK